jgi:hypothetical protein
MTAMAADCKIVLPDPSWSGRNSKLEAQLAVPEPIWVPGTVM